MQKALGGSYEDHAYGVQKTSDGGFVVAGTSTSSDGDVTSNYGSPDYWVVKLNNLGTIQWQKSLGGTNWDLAYSIQQTTDGGYIVAGDAGSTDVDVTGNHGGGDYWVVKLSADALTINSFEQKSVQIYPNPASTVLNIKVEKMELNTKLSIVDILGKTIYSQKMENPITTINITSFEKGIYLVQIKSSKGVIVKKIVKN